MSEDLILNFKQAYTNKLTFLGFHYFLYDTKIVNLNRQIFVQNIIKQNLVRT